MSEANVLNLRARAINALFNHVSPPVAACIFGLTLGAVVHFIGKASDEATAERMRLNGCNLTRVESVSFGDGSWKRTWTCPGGLTYVM